MDNGNSYYEVSERVVYSKVVDVPVLALTREPFEKGGIAAFVLNETGEFIWDRLNDQYSLQEILQQTVEAFEDDPMRIRQEVTRFFRIMENHGIIRIKEA